MWQKDKEFYDGVVTGYWNNKPVVIADNYGVAFLKKDDGYKVNDSSGIWWAFVNEENKWDYTHSSNYFKLPENDIEFEGNDEIDEVVSYNVGWV